MLINEYQDLACTTFNQKLEPKMALASLGLGLTGEAGEAADIIKKHVAHEHPLDVPKLTKEIGDVLWYAAVLSRQLGLTLEEVMEGNIAKLKARYPEGFSAARSLNRAE